MQDSKQKSTQHKGLQEFMMNRRMRKENGEKKIKPKLSGVKASAPYGNVIIVNEGIHRFPPVRYSTRTCAERNTLDKPTNL